MKGVQELWRSFSNNDVIVFSRLSEKHYKKFCEMIFISKSFQTIVFIFIAILFIYLFYFFYWFPYCIHLYTWSNWVSVFCVTISFLYVYSAWKLL